MDDQLHAADRIEKSLENNRLAGRQGAERQIGRGQVFDELDCRRLGDAGLCDQPANRRPAGRIHCQMLGDCAAQARDRQRQLVGAPGRFAEPERDRRRHAVRILDTHSAPLDAQDAISVVAELKDVAGHALDREILVDRADDLVFRFEHDLIVGGVGDRAAARQRGQPRAAPAAQQMVDPVVMNQRAAPAAPCGEPLGQHRHNRVEILARQLPVGPGAAEQRVKLVLAATLGRRLRRRSAAPARRAAARGSSSRVELASSHAVEQRRAFDQIVARQREQPPLRRAADRVAGAPDALQEGRDRARRAELADQIDIADVDAELERSGGDQAPSARRPSAAARRRNAAPSRGCRDARRPGPRPPVPTAGASRARPCGGC